MGNLTTKQRAFIDQYLLTLNGTESARLAGYQGDDNTLAVVAYENLRKPKIAAEIESRMGKLTISANETLARVSKQATGTMGDFLAFIDGRPYLSLDKARRMGKLDLIKKYRETETTRTTKDGEQYTTIHRDIELYPADGAHDRLMRYHSLYNDKVVHSWQQEIIDLITAGHMTIEQVKQELGDELATELFKSTGIPAIQGR